MASSSDQSEGIASPKHQDQVQALNKGPPANIVLRESHGSRIEKRGDVLTKSGPAVERSEITALQLIAKRLQIPVPLMHDFRTPSDGDGSISMEYVAGETLWDLWPSMLDEQKLGIARQLREILVAMRSLEPEAGGIGSCGGGPALDLRRYSTYRGGPFPDESGFNEFISSELFTSTPSILVNKFRQRLRSDHRIVFTHADLTQHNIIVRDGKVVALLDWQYAGWYPEYWEYIKFFARIPRDREWFEYADVIFPQSYDDEFFLHQFLIRYQLP